MKYLKLFENWDEEEWDESVDDWDDESQNEEELEGLYDEGATLLIDAANLLGDPELQNEMPKVVIDKLRAHGNQFRSKEANELANEIEGIEKEIAELQK